MRHFFFNNCNHLIETLSTITLKETDIVEFQGTRCGITRCTTDYIKKIYCRNNTMFGVDNTYDGVFDLFVFNGEVDFDDSYICISLPHYVKDELIATIKEEW